MSGGQWMAFAFVFDAVSAAFDFGMFLTSANGATQCPQAKLRWDREGMRRAPWPRSRRNTTQVVCYLFSMTPRLKRIQSTAECPYELVIRPPDQSPRVFTRNRIYSWKLECAKTSG